MRTYAYIAFTETGKKRSGTVIAETETHASAQLSDQGFFVSELTARATQPAKGIVGRSRSALNPDLQAIFTRQMAVLLGAEMPAEAALEAVRQGGLNSLDTVAAKTRAQLMDGATLSDALSMSGAGFAPYYIASVRSGEVAGDLAAVYEELAD
ncbi:MAG: type II secretion system F family protein, partial [Vibrio splendidus]